MNMDTDKPKTPSVKILLRERLQKEVMSRWIGTEDETPHQERARGETN